MRNRRIRGVAILIKHKNGNRFVDVLKNIRAKVKHEEAGVDLKSIKETRSGDVLVELKKPGEVKAKFGDVLRSAVGSAGEVRLLVPKAELDIRDLDAMTESEEVRVALITFFDYEVGGISRVNVSKANQ